MSAPAVPEARARAWAVAALVLTAGQIFWWHNDDAHRSMFSFVMTVVWACAVTVVMTRPIRRTASGR